jgi:muramoyltetrapeptide carboxypeptidase
MKAVINAFVEAESDAVMWARGGYGASELLPFMPWSELRSLKPKVLVGFSDVCAFHSALYMMTGQTSIHGPMPATVTWKQHGSTDVEQLIALLKGATHSGSFSTTFVPGIFDGNTTAIEGTLFGGSLAVLTGLIGTPYLPTSLKDHILLFEDITENPGRVMRALNQWQQSGRLAGVKALVLGAFTGLGGTLPDNAPMLQEEIARRFNLPVFKTTDFGHISPNLPFVVGSHARLSPSHLHWTLPPSPIS